MYQFYSLECRVSDSEDCYQNQVHRIITDDHCEDDDEA